MVYKAKAGGNPGLTGTQQSGTIIPKQTICRPVQVMMCGIPVMAGTKMVTHGAPTLGIGRTSLGTSNGMISRVK